MRDEHDGAGVVGEEGLEPGDGVDVEMVRRLVEQQQIGLRHQRPREQHAPSPSAGERVDDGVGGQAQPARARSPPAARCASRRAPPVRAGAARGARAPARSPTRRPTPRRGDTPVTRSLRSPEALGHDVEDREMLGERHVLVQPRRAQVRLAPDRAGIGLLLAAQDAQQRRFAAPVPAEHAHTLARLDLRAHLVEQRKVAEGERHAVERQQRHVFTLQRRPAARQRQRRRVKSAGT